MKRFALVVCALVCALVCFEEQAEAGCFRGRFAGRCGVRRVAVRRFVGRSVCRTPCSRSTYGGGCVSCVTVADPATLPAPPANLPAPPSGQSGSGPAEEPPQQEVFSPTDNQPAAPQYVPAGSS